MRFWICNPLKITASVDSVMTKLDEEALIYILCECEALYQTRHFHLNWPIVTPDEFFEEPPGALLII